MMRILVVEDSSGMRAQVRDVLEGEGYAVSEASNGAEALQLLVGEVEAEPSLIVVDLEMPVMSGWELLRIMSGYHRLARIPVLVLSAHELAGVAPAIPKGYIKKPFERQQLLSAVRSSLGDRH